MKTVILSILCALFFTQPAFSTEKILILGDSLTEGYGIDKEFAFPAVLDELLKKRGHDYKVMNGGISGSTTASGKSRLKWFMKAKPKILILALGANDGLRGVKLAESKKNLDSIIVDALAKNMKVVLAGMHVPPNYGEEYTKGFHKMYTDLAKKHKITLIPFLIDGVAGKKELNIEDGIHPNKKGHRIIAETVYKNIQGLL